jgi:hypothetical protein
MAKDVPATASSAASSESLRLDFMMITFQLKPLHQKVASAWGEVCAACVTRRCAKPKAL